MPLMRVHEFDASHRVFYPILINTAWIIEVRSMDNPNCGFDECAASSLRQWECNSVVHLAAFGRMVVRESIDRIEDLVKNANWTDHGDDEIAKFVIAKDAQAMICTSSFMGA